MRNLVPSFIIFLTFFIAKVSAQQVPHFSDFDRTRGYYNPAYHSINQIQGVMQFRYRSLGDYQGLANVQYDFSKGDKDRKLNLIGGFSYLHDKVGFFTSNHAKFNLAHKMKTEKIGSITFGLAVSIDQLTGDFTTAISSQYPDPSIPNGKESLAYLNADFGLFYRTPNQRGELGFASQQVVEDLFQLNYVPVFNYLPSRHYSVYASYVQPLGEGWWSIKPAVWYQTEFISHLVVVRAEMVKNTGLTIGLQYGNNKFIALSTLIPIMDTEKVTLHVNGLFGYAPFLPGGFNAYNIQGGLVLSAN